MRMERLMLQGEAGQVLPFVVEAPVVPVLIAKESAE